MSEPLPMIFVLIILLFSQQSLGHNTGNGVEIFVYHGRPFNQNPNYQHIPNPGYDQYVYTMPGSGFYSQNSFTNFQQESTYQQPLQYNQPSQYRPTTSNPPSFYYGAPPKYEHPYYHHHHHHHQHHHRPPPPPFFTPNYNHLGSWPSNVPPNDNNINTGCNSISTNVNQQIPTQVIANPEIPAQLPNPIPTFQPFPAAPSATYFPNVGQQGENDKQPTTSPSLNSSSTPSENLPADINDLISAVFPNIGQQGQNIKQPQASPDTPQVPFEPTTSPIPVFQPVPIIPTSPEPQQQTTSTTPIPVFQPNPITPETATNDSPILGEDDKNEEIFDIDIRHGFIDVINNDERNQTDTETH